MTWKQWFHGLLAALVGGVSPIGAFGVFGYAKGKILDWDFWEPVVFYSILNAGMVFEAYRRKFPPPGTLTVTTVTQTDSVKQIPGGATTTTATTKTETTERPEPLKEPAAQP